MFVIMMCVLVAGVVTVRIYKSAPEETSPDIVLLVIRDRDNCLDSWFFRSSEPVQNIPSSRSVTYLKCIAPSPWYPSAAASLMTGKYPSEHGLTRAHSHLSRNVATVAERIGAMGYWNHAVVEEQSLLSCTNVLQGFDEICEDPTWEAVEEALLFACDHSSSFSIFELIEIDTARFGSAGEVEGHIEKILVFLEDNGFFEKGIAAVCAPGGKADEFLALIGDPLGTPPGKKMLKPASLIDLHFVFRDLARGNAFPMTRQEEEGRAFLMEATGPLSDRSVEEGEVQPVQVTRTVWFEDLALHMRAHPDGKMEFLDRNGMPVTPEENHRNLVISRLERTLAELSPVRDVNVPGSSSPRLSLDLARDLGLEWNRPEFVGRRLHAVEHFRMGEALLRDQRPDEAIREFAAACAKDPLFPESLLLMARSCSRVDREKAVTHYQEFLGRFGSDEGQEAGAEEARRYLAR